MIVKTKRKELTSVGVDIGSSTSHVVFSQIVLEKNDNSRTEKFEIKERRILHSGAHRFAWNECGKRKSGIRSLFKKRRSDGETSRSHRARQRAFLSGRARVEDKSLRMVDKRAVAKVGHCVFQCQAL